MKQQKFTFMNKDISWRSFTNIYFSLIIATVIILLGEGQLKAQGTTCATATVVTPGTYTAAALTGTGATNAGATAAAWYVFTPATTGTLSINSCSGGSDTRLWISSGTCAAQVAVATNDDYAGCISVGTDEYASNIPSVILTGGVTYYFQWDNRWDATGFIWNFTYSPLPNNADANISGVTNQYTRRPLTQLTGGVPLGGTIQNLSGNVLTNVVLTASVYTLSDLVTPIAVFTSAPITINVAGAQTVTCGTWNPTASVEDYRIIYTETQDQTDLVPSNNVYNQDFSVDFNYYARDGGFYINGLGIATGNIRQGSQFTVVANDQLTGVQYYIGTTNAAQQYAVEVYLVTGGVMGVAPLYTSPTQTTTGIAGWNTYVFPAPLAVTPGEYAVIIYHSNTTAAVNIAVGYDDIIYTPLKQWIKITTGAWQHPEGLGFPIAYLVRPKFGNDPANDIRFVSNTEPQGEYSAIHTRQALAGTDLNFSAVGKNFGSALVNDVTLTVTVKDAANTVVYSAASATQNLNSGQIASFTVPTYTVTTIDDYTITYDFTSSGTDEILNNNSGMTYFSRPKDYMARNIDYTGSLGIGDNAVLGTYDNGILGQTYTITNADILDSVSFILISPPAGVPVRVDIYNTIAGVPTGSPIGSTTSYTTTINDNLNGVALTLPISISPLNLTAGTYYFGVIEEAGNITIATSEKIFTTNTVFIKWDANPNGAAVWSAVESFGASFERSFVINPVFKTCIDANIDFATTADMCLVGNGTITATVTGGTGAFTYSWEGSPETSNQRTNLIAGSYVLTVTDINACQTTGTAVVINDQTSFTIDAAIENVSCNGFSDGAIDISITGTSDPYSFEWTNMLTDEDISLLAAGDYSVTVTDDNGCQANMDFTVTQPLVLVANVSFPGVQCFGGTTDVTVIGVDGTAPYIGETTINLYAGSYTATITDDNGCIASTDYEITEPLLLTASSSSTEILCYGELSTVTISASDGTAPYSGVGDFDIAAGSYTYTVTDDNGCTATTDIEILEPSELLVNVISTPIECFGGTSIVTVSANQGTAPYTGEGDFEVFAGEYDYQVTDNNGCVTTTNIIVTEPAEVTGSQTFTICAGETITIGTDVYNESGTYYYTLVGAATTGCDSVVTTYLTVNDVIDVSVTTNVNTITATEESATWQWINCDGNTIIDGETLRNFTATETGDYAVIVTQNNCSDTSDCVNIIVSEIGITNSNDNLVVYPNPTSSEITIETSIEEGSLTLYNSVGQIIWTGIISKEQKQTIVLSDYENGVYFVKIENAEKSFVKAIVKQ